MDTYRFSIYALADSFRNRLTKTAIILLGNDGKFWVAFGRTAHKLMRQGYEAVQ